MKSFIDNLELHKSQQDTTTTTRVGVIYVLLLYSCSNCDSLAIFVCFLCILPFCTTLEFNNVLGVQLSSKCWPFWPNSDFVLGSYTFGSVKLYDFMENVFFLQNLLIFSGKGRPETLIVRLRSTGENWRTNNNVEFSSWQFLCGSLINMRHHSSHHERTRSNTSWLFVRIFHGIECAYNGW